MARLAAGVDSRIARLFASKGLERLSLDDFRRDYRLLVRQEGPMAGMLKGLSDALRGLDQEEVAVLGKMLIPPYRAILEDWVKQLKEEPNKPATEILSEMNPN